MIQCPQSTAAEQAHRVLSVRKSRHPRRLSATMAAEALRVPPTLRVPPVAGTVAIATVVLVPSTSSSMVVVPMELVAVVMVTSCQRLSFSADSVTTTVSPSCSRSLVW